MQLHFLIFYIDQGDAKQFPPCLMLIQKVCDVYRLLVNCLFTIQIQRSESLEAKDEDSTYPAFT